MNWHFGIVPCSVTYSVLSLAFLAYDTLVPKLIKFLDEAIEEVDSKDEQEV